MVDKNDPLMREVEEELRREQYAKLWERYGMYVMAGAALIVAIVAGYQFWNSRQLSLADAGGSHYEAALDLLDAKKPEEATKAFEDIVSSGHRGYTGLAQLQQAGAHLKAGKTKEALDIFEAMATNGSLDETIKTFAVIQAASLRLGEADFTEMQNRLTALADGTSSWRIPARELLGLAAFKAGKVEEARSMLTRLLGDSGTPRGTLERVEVVLSSIAAAEAGKSASAAPAAPATAPAAPAATAPESGAKDAPVAPAAPTAPAAK